MELNNIAGLLEKRRSALVEYCIGQVGKAAPTDDYSFLRTPADLFELLRMDPLDNYPVQSSWVGRSDQLRPAVHSCGVPQAGTGL